ncbi:hypothetical protein G5V59_25850 [Nocardioides sp. W3-2-3]|nr:hypothetical protein [Nocardioides convexus]
MGFGQGAGFLLRGLRLWRERPRLMLLGIVPALIVGVLLAGAFVALVIFADDLISLGHALRRRLVRGDPHRVPGPAVAARGRRSRDARDRHLHRADPRRRRPLLREDLEGGRGSPSAARCPITGSAGCAASSTAWSW